MIVYRSEDDGALYKGELIDVDPTTGEAEGYGRYEIPDTFTLNVDQILGGYGDIGELLMRAGLMKSV